MFSLFARFGIILALLEKRMTQDDRAEMCHIIFTFCRYITFRENKVLSSCHCYIHKKQYRMKSCHTPFSINVQVHLLTQF